jgi:hypothetical protein
LVTVLLEKFLVLASAIMLAAETNESAKIVEEFNSSNHKHEPDKGLSEEPVITIEVSNLVS